MFNFGHKESVNHGVISDRTFTSVSQGFDGKFTSVPQLCTFFMVPLTLPQCFDFGNGNCFLSYNYVIAIVRSSLHVVYLLYVKHSLKLYQSIYIYFVFFKTFFKALSKYIFVCQTFFKASSKYIYIFLLCMANMFKAL